MNLKELFSKLEKSSAFKDFRKENKDAFFCAAFIIMSIKQSSFENSLDFRNEKEIFTFKIQEGEKNKDEIIMQKEELLPSRKQLEKIDEKDAKNIKADVESLKKIVEEHLKKNKIENPLEEIIAVLQSSEDGKKLSWHMTCIASGFAIISIIINAKSGNIEKFEKKNLLDFMSVRKPEKK